MKGRFLMDGKHDKRIIKLTFTNYYDEYDEPRVDTVFVSQDSVSSVMQWYGGFFAGDPYIVTANGREVPQDINGEFMAPIIDGEVA